MLRLGERPIDPGCPRTSSGWSPRRSCSGPPRGSCRRRSSAATARTSSPTPSPSSSHAAAHRLDLDAVWRNQVSAEATPTRSRRSLTRSMIVINHPPARVRHIGEWCKKLDCWKRVEELDWRVPSTLRARSSCPCVGRRDPRSESISGLATADGRGDEAHSGGGGNGGRRNLVQCIQLGEGDSQPPAVAALAHIQPRNTCSARGTEPTFKQARQGELILAEAKRFGIRMNAVRGRQGLYSMGGRVNPLHTRHRGRGRSVHAASKCSVNERHIVPLAWLPDRRFDTVGLVAVGVALLLIWLASENLGTRGARGRRREPQRQTRCGQPRRPATRWIEVVVMQGPPFGRMDSATAAGAGFSGRTIRLGRASGDARGSRPAATRHLEQLRTTGSPRRVAAPAAAPGSGK